MKRIFWFAVACLISTNVFPSDVTLDIDVIGNDQKPIVKVKTNLPPKTMLMASLASPTNQGGNGYFGQKSATVLADQSAQFGPFTKNGDRLFVGNYRVTVTTVMTALQPEEVQPFFGTHGERLTGRHISTLAGTAEQGVSQVFQFRINPEGSISNPPSNEHTIGSTDDVWQKIQSGGRSIQVKTNGFFYDKEHYSGTGFRTYIVANLPESNIVGAPQSVMNDVEGNCETRTFHVLGALFFAGKDRTGMAMQNMPPETVARKLVPNSPFEKAFDLLCKIARTGKKESSHAF